MELAFAKYSVSAIKEYSDKVTFYLTNYNEKGIKQTDVIKIYGSTNKPQMTYTDRATPASCSISEDWTNGVYTMTVIHNGAVDITVNCAGNAIEKLNIRRLLLVSLLIRIFIMVPVNMRQRTLNTRISAVSSRKNLIVIQKEFCRIILPWAFLISDPMVMLQCVMKFL